MTRTDTATTDITEVRFAVVEAPRRIVEEVDVETADERFGETMTVTRAYVCGEWPPA